MPTTITLHITTADHQHLNISKDHQPPLPTTCYHEPLNLKPHHSKPPSPLKLHQASSTKTPTATTQAVPHHPPHLHQESNKILQQSLPKSNHLQKQSPNQTVSLHRSQPPEHHKTDAKNGSSTPLGPLGRTGDSHESHRSEESPLLAVKQTEATKCEIRRRAIGRKEREKTWFARREVRKEERGERGLGGGEEGGGGRGRTTPFHFSSFPPSQTHLKRKERKREGREERAKMREKPRERDQVRVSRNGSGCSPASTEGGTSPIPPQSLAPAMKIWKKLQRTPTCPHLFPPHSRPYF